MSTSGDLKKFILIKINKIKKKKGRKTGQKNKNILPDRQRQKDLIHIRQKHHFLLYVQLQYHIV